jgi:hypothetical protein
MQKEENTNLRERVDPLTLAIDTPKDKMPQFTVIPTGGVLAFAACKTIQQKGKPEFKKSGITSMEYLMDRIFEYKRSQNGKMLSGLLELAQTKLEVDASASENNNKGTIWKD